MSINKHLGKLNERKTGFRVPDLGYYYIVTNAVGTEPNYLNGIKGNIPASIRNRLIIKVKSTKTYDMISSILSDISKSAMIYEPWMVFDKDQIDDFDKLIATAISKGINVGWSNPCIEILFLAYLNKSPSPSHQSECIKEFSDLYQKLLMKQYKKNNEKIYKELLHIGNEENAIRILKHKYQQYINEGIMNPSKMYGVSTLYMLLEEINTKEKVR